MVRGPGLPGALLNGTVGKRGTVCFNRFLHFRHVNPAVKHAFASERSVESSPSEDRGHPVRQQMPSGSPDLCVTHALFPIAFFKILSPFMEI